MPPSPLCSRAKTSRFLHSRNRRMTDQSERKNISMTSSMLGREPETNHGRRTLLEARGVSKRYGSTVALAGGDIAVVSGEILGLVGHNGAGKSTLMRLLAGREAADTGTIAWHSGGAWNQNAAETAGVRMIYQELALCPDLTVAENIALSTPASTGWSWRRRAEHEIVETLDRVFPGHGIDIMKRTSDLPMPQRQMVEIARAMCTPNLSMLILDEPTESLSLQAMQQMYEALHVLAAQGIGMVLISHRMQEVLANADRIAVLKDGRIVEVSDASDTSEERLLVAMGGDVHADTAIMRSIEEVEESLEHSNEGTIATVPGNAMPFSVRAGEIVGLAGLAGHGQEELLKRLWNGGRGVEAAKRRTYVPGDRQTSGIFPLWTVADNLTVSATRQLATIGIISVPRQRDLAADWVDRLKVKGGAKAPITSLSGGNQQKVLIARAFATDAPLVLLDDPFRGVDVKTKNELYALMRIEASRGRSIVWYSTDNGEMAHCDRVYVFRSGEAVSELRGGEITEDRIIADSFGAEHHTDVQRALGQHDSKENR